MEDQFLGATIELPGLSLVKPSINSLDLGAFTALAGRPMQVILGYELFRACVVRFDYPEHMLDVWDAAHAPADVDRRQDDQKNAGQAA